MRPDSKSVADWLRRAKSDLAIARASAGPEAMWESFCYAAQQAAEKALKAVLIHFGLEPPRTHHIEQLLHLLATKTALPTALHQAVRLSDYALETRYPSFDEDVTQEEYEEALQLAETVVAWAEDIISGKTAAD
jgi:HEPN domain-containing protein